MGTRNGSFFCGILLSAVSMGLPARSAALPAEATVLVFLQNQAGVPERICASARNEVVRLYSLIGVNVRFVAKVRSDATRIRVIALVPWQPDDRAVPDSALGVTYGTRERRARMAYVFWRRVERASQQFTASLLNVLAAAMAHELGHMLLPEGSHAKRGLMEAPWNANHFRLASAGLLHFSPETAALIRGALIDSPSVIVGRRVPE